MRHNSQVAHMANELTRDTVRPIRGVEDVEGAPVWKADKYNEITKFSKQE